MKDKEKNKKLIDQDREDADYDLNEKVQRELDKAAGRKNKEEEE